MLSKQDVCDICNLHNLQVSGQNKSRNLIGIRKLPPASLRVPRVLREDCEQVFRCCASAGSSADVFV